MDTDDESSGTQIPSISGTERSSLGDERNRRAPIAKCAEYVSHTHPLHTGNPLIDALPVVKSDQDWAVQLTNGVHFDPSQRTLDAYLR